MEIWFSVVKSSITTKFPVYLLTIGLPTELRRIMAAAALCHFRIFNLLVSLSGKENFCVFSLHSPYRHKLWRIMAATTLCHFRIFASNLSLCSASFIS